MISKVIDKFIKEHYVIAVIIGMVFYALCQLAMFGAFFVLFTGALTHEV